MSIRLENALIERDIFKLGPINFSFESKGLYLIEGKNGSGKTSLLKAILGRLKLKTGSISKSSASIASLGIEPILYSEWTAEENFQFLSSLSGSRGQPPEFLQKQKYIPVSHLSAGQKRMIEIEIVLQLTAPILLLDEPANSLDEENLKSFESKIIKASENKLVIMTSHIHSKGDLPFSDILRLSA